MTTLSFHGAARNVTGSCFLLEEHGTRVLVDCGMYQGDSEAEDENAQAFGFEPESVDYLLLTHAHLDHCGRIPLLVERGFQGEILTTSATRELARIVLLDAAHINEEDARRRERWRKRHGGDEIHPLYTRLSALRSFDRFGRNATYGDAIELTDGLHVRFHDAGHILGSAFLSVEIGSGKHTRRLLFSGDLGRAHSAILRAPDVPPHADDVVMESTYGDRRHKSLEASVDELYDAIADTFERGGNVLIPTFALERAQEILFFLRKGIAAGKLPRTTPVFLDSPMAISATEIFRNHPECYDQEAARLFAEGHDPFQLPELRFTATPESSKAINQIESGAIIMAGSGMCTGGRIQHHLKHNLWRDEASVVFVGFAAPRTLARRIVDGAKTVRIFGESLPVRARVYTINGFSAHADQAELLQWHEHTGRPKRTFLVHGDPKRGMSALANALEKRGHPVTLPKLHESITLG